MKKFLGNIKKKSGSPERNGSSPVSLPHGDAPEAVVVREVTAFCESSAPNSATAGEEYLHLPAIVDAAESSPTAAKEAAATIRRYLSREHNNRGYAQYNAVMLSRILTDNPGHVFTQNFDVKFVTTVKELLREGKDTSVQQILRETLDYFEFQKAPGDDGLGPLIEMWRKEKGKRNNVRSSVGWGSLEAVGSDHHADYQQQYRVPPPPSGQYTQSSGRRRDALPPPDELVSRIEEAKTTARLLVQTVQSTPSAELLSTDLVQEFAERARSAQRSIQGYLNCQHPAPDPDTTLTLIETNDLLNIAMSKHQRAVLQARKSNGLATPSPQPEQEPAQNPLSMPQHNLGQNVYSDSSLTDQRPYATSPPRRQNPVPSPPISPQKQDTHEQFAPPPGPPPASRRPTGAQTTGFDYDHADSASEQRPPVPDRARPPTDSYVSTSAYGVSENPFADDAYGEGPNTSKTSNGLIDFSEDTPSAPSQQSVGNQHISELAGDQQRPGPYSSEYKPTPSYMHRQDSSVANLTMHGGSPPAGLNGQGQNGPHETGPVSPVYEAEGVGRRMNDLRI
ncbi:hypothetical protein EDD37DRAFT_642765 [Exophiala viscosa]|uniref:uncharacterized protein n=1 Tax=Exophiala viscosa TaxID=2486360 RepID=UPI00219BFE8A|nr:hypothetical protein EDD37DRAFT_642765 [Exophiala viscosa]